MLWLKIMKLIDTNIILRYMLNDHAELSKKASDIIANEDVLLYSHQKISGKEVVTFDKKLFAKLQDLK